MFRNNLEEEKKVFINYFHSLWGDSKPLCLLFRTTSKGYLYDTGTNRILDCSDTEYILLENILNSGLDEGLLRAQRQCSSDALAIAIENILSSAKEKNILKTNRASKFGLSAHFKDLDTLIDNSLQMLILEVTERCNLRCAYCIYNPSFTQKRNHGINDMNFETASSAIRYLDRCSHYQERIAITFYGGEPLLCFPMIQDCVNYAKKTIPKANIHFGTTTNATLITPQIAKYFAKEGFGIHVSIDGPKDIHDQYRKDNGGQGTFTRVISSLKILLEAYGEEYHKVSLSMVYAPPYSQEKIERISQLWDEYDWLPKDILTSITYAEENYPLTNLSPKDVDTSLMDWAKRDFLNSYCQGSKSHPFAARSLEGKLAHLVKRPIIPMPLAEYNLNGCCLPAVRKLYASTRGEYYLCERIGIAPNVGNVDSGVDKICVKEIYIDEYAKESIKKCADCWALQLCNICYVHVFYNGKINMTRKEQVCSIIRMEQSEYLKLYCSLLEINERGLEYLENWQIS